MKAKLTKLALLIALLAGLLFWGKDRFLTSEEEPPLYGNVDIRELSLAFRATGRVSQLFVEEGDFVKTGDLLARLDLKPLENHLQSAQASLQLSQSQFTRAQAAFFQAKNEFERQKALITSGAVSQKDLEAAQSHFLQTRAEQEVARANIAFHESALALSQTALEDGSLRAPSDAQVSVRLSEVGSMVNANVPVFYLSLQSPLFVRAYVSETKLARTRPGTHVWVRADGAPKAFLGVIGFVSPRAEFTPKSVETAELRTDLVYRLRIVIEDKDALEWLRQGMPVTVTFAASQT